MGGRRAMPLPMSAVRFAPAPDVRSRTDDDQPRAVLRGARHAVRTMRLADRAGRRAHTAHDLDAFEAAWRGFQDAAQDYRAAASRWEALGALRAAALDDFPVAPPWHSNDLRTDLGPVMIDLAAADEQSTVSAATADTAPDA